EPARELHGREVPGTAQQEELKALDGGGGGQDFAVGSGGNLPAVGVIPDDRHAVAEPPSKIGVSLTARCDRSATYRTLPQVSMHEGVVARALRLRTGGCGRDARAHRVGRAAFEHEDWIVHPTLCKLGR